MPKPPKKRAIAVRPVFDLETAAQRLREDAAFAEELRKTSKADNTRRAYRADWEPFELYCETLGADWRKANATFIAAYLASLLRRDAVTAATVKRARSGISAGYREAKIEPNPVRGGEVRDTVNAICKRLGTAQKKKAPLLVEPLLKMMEAAGTSLRGRRDRAILAVGFSGAFRRSEIAALTVDALTFDARGVQVLLSRSKTDQGGAGQLVGIPRQTDSERCPVAALELWLKEAGITEGAVFRRLYQAETGLGPEALKPDAIAGIVKRHAEAVGIDPATVAGHSLRTGFVTEAIGKGASEGAIMAQTRHKSITVMRGYIQKASVFQNNVAAKIWD